MTAGYWLVNGADFFTRLYTGRLSMNSAHSLCTHALHRKMKVFIDTRQFVELSSRVLIPVVSRHNDSSVFTSTQLWHAYTGR